ncbi:carboxypeptidase regulatory-like domain-containing protein [Aquimarina sp. 2201CG14-23]|uniref:carboxypeptidase regulatory-like domain-containing protein n=1 Tax=Aquimarina mycalae TaxID=3040073 RepID=UPI0024780F34|nr:carboxypeptidase regulatory-like domain-containing protein [Aquimarina sp. 2201CG14-23]MDH7444626.1 carboxypeptidase regulatory-like domain-containing protein [Aquimarina sp. 2201CG14-23]
MKKYIIKIVSVLAMVSMIACSEDTIDLEGLGTVRGTVVAVGTNEPLENVKISTNPSSSTVFTNVDGEYIIENIPSGDYSLSAQREGLLAQFEAISVIADRELEIVFEMDIETAGNRPPAAAVLDSPADNSIDQPLEVKLVWTGSDPDDDTLTYSVTLRNDENSDIEVFENITDTTYTVTGLSYKVKYFWQVSSNDGINDAVNSETFAFETMSPPNNRIVYMRSVNGNSVIYSANEQGGTEIVLTSESKNSFRPRRHVSTGKIAFLQSVGSQTHLFTMNEDGTQAIQVTSQVSVSGFNLGEVDFSWSDNGAKLLFPNQDKLYSINADGSGLSLLYQTTNGNLITEVDKNDTNNIIVLKTNNLDGYEVEIFTINTSGTLIDTILTGVSGAAGSVNLSVDGTKLLYCQDVSGFESSNYRQLDTHLFVYNFSDSSILDISAQKPAGTNDLDARFSPNESAVIFVNTSNDGISQNNIQTMSILEIANRADLIQNASMADWE